MSSFSFVTYWRGLIVQFPFARASHVNGKVNRERLRVDTESFPTGRNVLNVHHVCLPWVGSTTVPRSLYSRIWPGASCKNVGEVTVFPSSRRTVSPAVELVRFRIEIGSAVDEQTSHMDTLLIANV